MKEKLSFAFFLVIILFQIYVRKTEAIYDPSLYPNNKLGIHIIDENDLDEAAVLVNSSGGEWGYVTIVITQNDRSINKWQPIFDRMSKLHLIPIIRLATYSKDGIWVKPEINDVSLWVNFLSNLYWVTKNRYIILFNEPNHAKEWGGRINPQEYSDIVQIFQKALKEKSEDFYILPAGLDASAPNGSETMDEKTFLSEMAAYKINVLKDLDGWTSHSYPNPGFVGKVSDRGKGTLQTYKWELSYLKSLGVPKDFPVFITETGWPHGEGLSYDNKFISASVAASNYQIALETIWNDPLIIALTPFVFNYQAFPFVNFSWKKPASSEYYQQYEIYKSFPKISGKPLFDLINTLPLFRSIDLLTDINLQLTTLKSHFYTKKLSFIFPSL